MKSDYILDALEELDEEMIRDARNGGRLIPFLRKRRWAAAAAILCLSLSVLPLCAALPGLHQLLYRISPAAAQFFQPVHMACEDNGIRMEVLAAYVHGDTAQIYLTLQDLEGERIDETTDLFDSFNIYSPYPCSGSCQMAGYDPAARTAAFLVTLQQWEGQNMPDGKITFSVQEFISGKQSYSGPIPGVNLSCAQEAPLTQSVTPRGMSFSEGYEAAGLTHTALDCKGSMASPLPGVVLTGMGYVEDALHIQIYYDNILETDSHGWVELRDKETGKAVSCTASLAFWDQEQRGSYQDYIFPDIKKDTLKSYELYGEFSSSGQHIEGNWRVTFPLENVAESCTVTQTENESK